LNTGTSRTPPAFVDGEAPTLRDGVAPPVPPWVEDDEALVADARAELRPSEMVERKLRSLLKGGPLPLSHVRTAGLPHGHGRR